MPTQTITTDLGRDRTDAPRVRVYLRQTWNESWQEIAHLYADSVTFAVSPDMPTATLRWIYGRVLHPGASVIVDEVPLDDLDWYCKIVIGEDPASGATDERITWYGVIVEQVRNDRGVPSREDLETGEDTRVQTGVQTLTCYGLEYLLDRVRWDKSWVLDDVGVSHWVARPIGFNRPREHYYLNDQVDPADRNICGNRTTVAGPRGVTLFATDLKTAAYWDTWDIVQYVFAYMTPANAVGEENIRWNLASGCDLLLPLLDRPLIRASGDSDPTVRNIFDQLFDRRRGFCWWCAVGVIAGEGDEPDTEYLEIHIATFTAEAIPLPSGGFLQPNPDQVALDFSNALDVVTSTLKDSAVHQAERVVVRGARKRAMVSLSYADQTLEADWKEGDQTDYETGPDTTGLDEFERDHAIASYRKQDRLERVFTHFRLVHGWYGQVGDGIGGAKCFAFPADPENPGEGFYYPEMRFSREVFPGITLIAPGNSPEGPSRPLAFIRARSGDNERWEYADRLAASDTFRRLTADFPGSDCSFSLKMQQHGPGIVITPHGSDALPHILAENSFTPITDVDTPPRYDWMTDLIVTVCLEHDTRVQVGYPSLAEFEANLVKDVARIEYIDLGERARWDCISEGTVIGVEEGALVHQVGLLTDRDDRPWMENLARFAWLWYGSERRAFAFGFRQISALLNIGKFVTQIGPTGYEEAVNSVVTSVHYDLLAVTTEVTTAYAELDWMAV